MTTIIKSIHRATITLGIPGKIADLILWATDVVQKLTNDPSFPTPTPTVQHTRRRKFLDSRFVLLNDTSPTSRQRTAVLPDTDTCQQSLNVPAGTVYVS